MLAPARFAPRRGAPLAPLVLIVVTLALVPAGPLDGTASATSHTPTFVESWYTFPGGPVELVNVTVWYDASHYSNKWSWYLPFGFRPVAVSDDLGSISFTEEANGQIVFETHYAFGSGYKSFKITGSGAATKTITEGMYLSSAWAPATEGNARLVIEAPAGGVVLLPNGTQYSRWVETRSKSISRAFLFVHKDAIESRRLGNTTHYALLTPASWESSSGSASQRAFAVANLAEAFIPRLENITGLPMPQGGRVLVIYAPSTLFEWEAGWYQSGVIAVRAEDYENASYDWDLRGGSTLVHETSHAFLDEPLDWAGGGASWFDEGLATYSDNSFEDAHPEWLVECKPGFYCQNLSSKIGFDDIKGIYENGTAFDREWTPHATQTTASRHLAYERAGFVVGAYVAQFGEAALVDAIARIKAQNDVEIDAECKPCVLDALERLLMEASHAATASPIYQPYRAEFATGGEALRCSVKGLVVFEQFFLKEERGNGEPRCAGHRPLQAIVPDFTLNTTLLDVNVDSSTSRNASDDDEVDWDWGEGRIKGRGIRANHTYSAPGIYEIRLTITAVDGRSFTTSKLVEIKGPNVPPVARLNVTTDGLTAVVDAADSTDGDGFIAAYEWDWGDGNTSTDLAAIHAYSSAGQYTLRLTVVDNQGGEGETSASVTVRRKAIEERSEDTGGDDGRSSDDATASKNSGENGDTTDGGGVLDGKDADGELKGPGSGETETPYPGLEILLPVALSAFVLSTRRK